jgi:CRP-like cAMP-binding protein
MARLDPAELRALLARHSLLGQLPVDVLDRLAQLTRVVRIPARQTVFLKGEETTGMMIVLRGRVRISATSAEGKEIVLNIIDPDEVFGEIALLDGKPRTADATTMEDTELLVLDRREFVPFLEANPQVCLRLLALLCERVRRTTDQLEGLALLDLRLRLIKTLLQLADAYGEPVAGGVRIGIRLTQSELAAILGAGRESVNKQLHALAAEGAIALEHRSVTIRDVAALRRTLE